MKTNTLDKKERARERVKQLKGFYIHLTVYLFINTIISLISVISITNGFVDRKNFTDIILDFSGFNGFASWFFWGIGLFFHAVRVFSLNPFFSKDWEEKQIKKYIEEDRQEIEKFR